MDTEECAQRACLRIADVIVMHSVVINATGSTAMEMGVLFGVDEAMLAPFLSMVVIGVSSDCESLMVD